MHKSTTPSLSQTIWPRWASRQFLILPIVQTFGYSLSSEAVIMRQLRTWRIGCDEAHWHTHTRGLPWGLPAVVRTVQQVHCSRMRLLRRGLEFHECTVMSVVPIRKKSGKLFNDARIYIYIYIKTHKLSSYNSEFYQFDLSVDYKMNAEAMNFPAKICITHLFRVEIVCHRISTNQVANNKAFFFCFHICI